MTAWNVRRSVVDIIEADTPEQAERELRNRLTAAGFDPYEDDDYDTYESD